MMKHFYLRIVLLFFLGATFTNASAQLSNPPFYVETIVHNGNYGEANHDLTGYVTFRVYIQFDSPDNYLTSVFAAESPADCVQDADSTVFINAPCGLFQHEIGTAFGFSETCLYPAFVPTSQYDSFMTIGAECSNQVSNDFVNFLGQCASWTTDFEGSATTGFYDGASFFWDEAAIFAAPAFLPYPQSISHADPNGRVLVGQFTTCGDINGCMNITYVNPNMQDVTVLDICFSAEQPCTSNVMDNTPSVTTAECAGGATIVQLSDGGNGNVDYTLYDQNDVVINTFLDQASGLTINPIAEGTYYLTMIDDLGCRDTTAEFTVAEPEPLTLNVEVVTDELCFGENAGSIQVDCSGGSGSLVVVLNNAQQIACGTLIENLTCGDYEFILTDENDCEVIEEVSISCPAQLQFNPTVTVIECFGYDDGSILGNVNGGTGDLTVTWLYNGNPHATFTGPAPLNIGISNLDSGTYDLTVTDENNCEFTASYEITEPAEFSATYPFTDATCFGFCDGTIVPEIVGGTEPYTVTGTILNGGGVNLNALCANDIHVVITDDNGCIVQDTITISQPDDITYTLTTDSCTCFASCDGAIQIEDVLGGYGNYTYTFTPNTGNCPGTCGGNSIEYSDLCAGLYDVLITDQGGCEKVIPDVEIGTPNPIQIVMDPTDVTCYGLSDGEVFIDVIGGTAPVNIEPNNVIAPATISGLSIGTYTFTVTDFKGCTAEEDVIINQPDSLFGQIMTTENISCGGACDGSINYEVFGGTLPYDYYIIDSEISGPVNGFISSLCADEYYLVISDLFNCTDTIEFTLTEPSPLDIAVLLNAPTCTGMFDGSAEVVISGGTGDLTLFITPEETDVLEQDSVTYNLSGLGEGEIYFQLIDEENCALLDTLEIVPDIITDMVLTTFSTPETCWNENDGTATVMVQNGFLPITFEWDDPDMQTTATATGLASSQEYTVIVTDDIGCTLSTSVFVEPTVGCFFIATAITPNGDGVNDTWVLGGLEYYPDCEINVFNRWGQLVYSSNGYTNQWDATYQGELLPVADYYFTIDYSPNADVIMGTVTIKY